MTSFSDLPDTARPETAARSDSDDFRPTASLETLRLRAQVLAVLRDFFQERGYWEVETPLLSHDIVVDAHLEPFVCPWSPTGGLPASEDSGNHRPLELFLQTSPEFGMKRLLASGAEAIFQITRAFRNGEVGRLHNPEFTMIEWYRVGDDHHRQMCVVEELVRAAAGALQDLCGTESSPAGLQENRSLGSGRPLLSRIVSSAMSEIPFERLTYDEAFEQTVGTRVLHRSAEELAQIASGQGLAPPASLGNDRDAWLNYLLAERVEPHLGLERPTFLYDYPASQAALARLRAESPPVAERFELYIQGIEICNGYHELTDAEELRRRMRDQQALRQQEGRRPLPLDNRLLRAMEAGLPPCSGVALGFDRLLMLLIGADSIQDVLAFPFDRA